MPAVFLFRRNPKLTLLLTCGKIYNEFVYVFSVGKPREIKEKGL